MSEPSKEAMDAAEKHIVIENNVLVGEPRYTTWVLRDPNHTSRNSLNALFCGSHAFKEHAEEDARRAVIMFAEALDAHTADLRREVEATKRELVYTEKSLKEVRVTNAEYGHAWQAVISAMLGNEFENPKNLGGIQIADALRAERDGLRAEVEALRARVADTEWRESSKVEPDVGVIVEGWDGQDTYIHLYQRAAINYCQCEEVCVCDSPNPVVEWCLYEDAELVDIYKHQVEWTAWEYWESGIIAPEYWRPYIPPKLSE